MEALETGLIQRYSTPTRPGRLIVEFWEDHRRLKSFIRGSSSSAFKRDGIPNTHRGRERVPANSEARSGGKERDSLARYSRSPKSRIGWTLFRNPNGIHGTTISSGKLDPTPLSLPLSLPPSLFLSLSLYLYAYLHHSISITLLFIILSPSLYHSVSITVSLSLSLSSLLSPLSPSHPLSLSPIFSLNFSRFLAHSSA